jgi:hypothetical protein
LVFDEILYAHVRLSLRNIFSSENTLLRKSYAEYAHVSREEDHFGKLFFIIVRCERKTMEEKLRMAQRATREKKKFRRQF